MLSVLTTKMAISRFQPAPHQ